MASKRFLEKIDMEKHVYKIGLDGCITITEFHKQGIYACCKNVAPNYNRHEILVYNEEQRVMSINNQLAPYMHNIERDCMDKATTYSKVYAERVAIAKILAYLGQFERYYIILEKEWRGPPESYRDHE